ncbi:hypothetical protein [Nocardia brasiliensis]|uniref:hypothetical protein n=1 Tax=Nocardia brasiliensis TaxID=37326 RepID=UPI00340D8D26
MAHHPAILIIDNAGTIEHLRIGDSSEDQYDHAGTRYDRLAHALGSKSIDYIDLGTQIRIYWNTSMVVPNPTAAKLIDMYKPVGLPKDPICGTIALVRFDTRTRLAVHELFVSQIDRLIEQLESTNKPKVRQAGEDTPLTIITRPGPADIGLEAQHMPTTDIGQWVQDLIGRPLDTAQHTELTSDMRMIHDPTVAGSEQRNFTATYIAEAFQPSQRMLVYGTAIIHGHRYGEALYEEKNGRRTWAGREHYPYVDLSPDQVKELLRRYANVALSRERSFKSRTHYEHVGRSLQYRAYFLE